LSYIATIGFFDGVHTGHQFLFERLRSEALSRGLKPLVVTFDTHPRAVLQSDYVPQLLTTKTERTALLQSYGEVLLLPFASIQSLTAMEFLRFLHDQHGVTTLLMGYDHRFGSDRLSHPSEYRRAGAQCGVEVLTDKEFLNGEWHVSSTEIRQALLNGNIALASELLGRPYALQGQVVHGNGIGRSLGFPTANIQPEDPCKIIPKSGVYEVAVEGAGMQSATGICNIGTNPTIGNEKTSIEVHIPSFSADLYGQTLQIRFMRFIRDEKQFEHLDALREQIKADVDSIRHPASSSHA